MLVWLALAQSSLLDTQAPGHAPTPLPAALERHLCRERALDLRDWAPLRGFDAAAHAFFSGRDLGELPAPSVAPSPLAAYGVGAKLRLWDAPAQGFDLDLAAFSKVPFGRSDLLHLGAAELAVAAVARRGPFQIHAGATLPFGQEDLFELAPDVRLASFAFAGAGLSWRVSDAAVVGVQLELNTSAFRDVELLQRHPAGAVAAARSVWGRLVLEAGLGAGVDRVDGFPWMGYLSLSVAF